MILDTETSYFSLPWLCSLNDIWNVPLPPSFFHVLLPVVYLNLYLRLTRPRKFRNIYKTCNRTTFDRRRLPNCLLTVLVQTYDFTGKTIIEPLTCPSSTLTHSIPLILILIVVGTYKYIKIFYRGLRNMVTRYKMGGFLYRTDNEECRKTYLIFFPLHVHDFVHCRPISVPTWPDSSCHERLPMTRDLSPHFSRCFSSSFQEHSLRPVRERWFIHKRGPYTSIYWTQVFTSKGLSVNV